MRRTAFLGTVLLAGLAAGVAGADEGPAVVASILPLGGIAAAVMDGVGAPAVLLEPGSSPHAYSLRPSQARALSEADLILWVGHDLEAFLERPLAALGGSAVQLELAEVSGMRLLPYRKGALFEVHEHGGHGHDDHDHDHDDHAHDHDDHGHGGMDGHVWLSPANARVIADAVAAALGEIDAARAGQYVGNAERFAATLDAVEAEIDALLAPVRGRPFIVFHDAYHYFEQAFGIFATGAIHLSPEVQPGAARIAEIQERIGALEAACVFAEPQFEPRIIETVIEGSDARSGVLDPLGAGLALGPDTYPELLRRVATSLAECLGG